MIVPNCEVVRNLLITNRHEHWTANNLVILLPEWTGLPKYYLELINTVHASTYDFLFARQSPNFELAAVST